MSRPGTPSTFLLAAAAIALDISAAGPLPINPDFADPDACHTVVSGEAGVYFGWAVAAAGDLNGDGLSDIAVGERWSPGYRWGQLGIVLGNASGRFCPQDWIVPYPFVLMTGNEPEFGSVLAGAGDVDGDGLDDLLVGAPNHSDDFFSGAKGVFYLYRGAATGAPVLLKYAQGATYGAHLGAAMAAMGDLNHDGYDEILVSAPGRSLAGVAYARNVYLHAGSPTGFATSSAWLVSETSTWRLGAALASGDFDGDGQNDAILGAPSMSAGQAGRIDGYRGLAQNLSSTLSWTRLAPGGEPTFGAAVASAGDVNGDGFDDLLVGAPGSPAGEPGTAYLYFGSAAGPSASPSWSRAGGAPGDRFGNAISTAHDVNGDGYDDLLVGAPADSGSGRTYLFLGGPAGPGSTPIWVEALDDQPGSQSGSALASARDFDGDGTPDLVVGTPSFDAGVALNAGRADLVLSTCPPPGTVGAGVEALHAPPEGNVSIGWPAVAMAAHYNTYRGTIPRGYMGSRGGSAYDHVCLESADTIGDGPRTTNDDVLPELRTAFYYLISGENGCTEGSLGEASNGTPRPKPAACPTPP